MISHQGVFSEYWHSQRENRLMVFLAYLEQEGARLKQPIMNQRWSKTKVHNKSGRVCITCNTFKKWDQFYKRKAGVNGYNCVCIPCWRNTNNKHGLERVWNKEQ